MERGGAFDGVRVAVPDVRTLAERPRALVRAVGSGAGGVPIEGADADGLRVIAAIVRGDARVREEGMEREAAYSSAVAGDADEIGSRADVDSELVCVGIRGAAVSGIVVARDLVVRGAGAAGVQRDDSVVGGRTRIDREDPAAAGTIAR